MIGRSGKPGKRAGGARTPRSDAATVAGRPAAPRDIALVTRAIPGHWTPILALGFDPDGAVRSVSEQLGRRTRDDPPCDEAGLRAWIANALSEPTAATARPPAPAR